jgi:hypothetical protein
VNERATDQQRDLEVVQRELRTPNAAGVAGIVFGVLFVTSVILLRLAVNRRFGPGPLHGVRPSLAVAGLYLVPFAGIAFLWFIAVVRNSIGEREDKFFATVFLGSGLLFIAMLFAGAAAGGALAAGKSFGTASAANPAMTDFARSFAYALLFVYATKAAGVFVISTSTLIRGASGWPRWMAVSGYVIGIVLLFSVTFWEAILLLFPLWVIVVSVRILLSEATDSRSPGVG